MMLEDHILQIGRRIESLAERLAALGYRFDDPDAAFPGREANVEASICRIESVAGALPLAIKLFWKNVGSVDFTGAHPQWDGCEYPDPLVVFPASTAVEELEEFLADRDERLRCGFPYAVPIAPDSCHKAGTSGGLWYNLTVPAVADDPPLNEYQDGLTFVAYLELALRWGGFPGLINCRHHNWPVAALLS